MEKGYLFILSGPSGVGKGSLRKEIMKQNDLNLYYSISMTTRTQREGEVEGSDYYFVTRKEFEKQIRAKNFLECAEFVGNYYGTPKDKVEAIRNSGQHVLMEIDTNGVSQVLEKCKNDPKVVTFFILPPSIEELENRIRGRRTESEESIQSRLTKAQVELTRQYNYKYRIVNDDLEKAAQEIKDIMRREIHG